jgi:hypothetical protein
MSLVRIINASFVVFAVFSAYGNEGNAVLNRMPELVAAAKEVAAKDTSGVQVKLLEKLLAQPKSGDRTVSAGEAAAAALRELPNPALNAVGYLGSRQGTEAIMTKDSLSYTKLPGLTTIIVHLAPLLERNPRGMPRDDLENEMILIFHNSIDYVQTIVQSEKVLPKARPYERQFLLLNSLQDAVNRLPDGPERKSTLMALEILKAAPDTTTPPSVFVPDLKRSSTHSESLAAQHSLPKENQSATPGDQAKRSAPLPFLRIILGVGIAAGGALFWCVIKQRF